MRRSYVLDNEARRRSNTMIQELYVLDYMGGREWDGWDWFVLSPRVRIM